MTELVTKTTGLTFTVRLIKSSKVPEWEISDWTHPIEATILRVLRQAASEGTHASVDG